MISALLVLVAVLFALRWRAERRHRKTTRRQLELIANHIQAQQPAKRPELRVLRGGRSR